ncbi:hypothetical protein QTP86_008760 [Hemibagrus guttatus]|nr:hypothetical protein QTP86_008760 [Hemibagrus guttatus]
MVRRSASTKKSASSSDLNAAGSSIDGPPLFPWSGEPSDIPAVEEWYQQSQEVWERAHVRLQRAVRRQRIQADWRRRPHPSYQVGQKVWLSTRNLRLKLPCRKLSPRFIGPFKIIPHGNPVTYRLRLPVTYRICPMFHVSLMKPAHPSTEGAPAGGEPPPPLDVEGSPAYRVWALLDSRQVRSRVQYLMDWEGSGAEEQSWVDALEILPSRRTSTVTTRISLHRVRGGVRDIEPQEVFLEGGALSWPTREWIARGSSCPFFETTSGLCPGHKYDTSSSSSRGTPRRSQASRDS